MSCRLAWPALLAIGAVCGAHAQTAEDRKLLDEAAAIDRQFEQRGLVYHDAALERYLANLSQPLLPTSSPDYVHWHFRILREPLINAFALPNGSVYVDTGLLAVLENDDQLAGVLAHEITHVAEGHTFRFARSYRKKAIAGEAMQAAWAGSAIALADPVLVVIRVNRNEQAMAATVLGYGRSMEREADQAAVGLLQAHHRDAAQLARTFELLDEHLDPEPAATFWSRHPKTQDRIAYTQAMINGRKVEHPVTDPAYLARMRPVILQNLRLDLDSRRFRTAVARAQRLVDANPDDPESLYWLGEAYRSLGPRAVLPPATERMGRGRNRAHRKAMKQTEEEENRALAATPEGRASLQSNQAKAAEYFRKAGDLPKAHFGLGTLYEQEGKNSQALAEYGRYLELAPRGDDRIRVERRMEALSRP